jgi:diguanylate cyclase (GGDEF)-like protein/PAS domain S-box-containing protein
MLISPKTIQTQPSAASELSRLRALDEYAVFDTPPEPDLDRLVELAARMFAIPVAALSLVGRDRLYFKSCFGMEATGITRDGSFCEYAIAQDGLFLVPDAGNDERFAAHPLVAGAPQIRSYAGVPLAAPSGEKIGTLCILDTKPRPQFTADDRKNLEDVAARAMSRLELCRLQKAQLDGHARFERIASTSPDAVLFANAFGIINYWNNAAETLLGYACDEAIGQPIGFLFPERVRRRQTADLRELSNCETSEPGSHDVQAIARRKDGTEFNAGLIVSSSQADPEGGFGIVVRDAVDSYQREHRLFDLANLDELTGLPNRTQLLKSMDDAARPDAGTLLRLDFAGFGDVNDALGYSSGDFILRQAADRLRTRVAGRGTVARLGADGFAVLLPALVDGYDAAKVADELLREFDEPFEIDGEPIHLTINIGIAVCPLHGTRAEQLLANANLALQRAEARGGGGYLFFTPKFRQAVLTRPSLEAELHQALARNEFELRYQPQVRMSDECIIGAEALLRWRHPIRGFLAPGAFLSVLESGPLASPVGEWVLNTACADAAEWCHTVVPDFRVAVNLFGAQFQAGGLPTQVERALLAHRLPARSLELEITENIVLGQEEAILVQLRELHTSGVGIAFDDYGTGYGSLGFLKRFPVTRLKIDQSFVRAACRDTEDAAIVQAIVHLGRCFELGIIAEGVETEQQHEAIKIFGCAEGQGFFYAEPVTAEALGRCLRHDHERTVA